MVLHLSEGLLTSAKILERLCRYTQPPLMSPSTISLENGFEEVSDFSTLTSGCGNQVAVQAAVRKLMGAGGRLDLELRMIEQR
jgi:hypothetical protein